jgi:hypothetical protein
MKRSFRNILAHIKRMVEEQTSHDSYLEIFCSWKESPESENGGREFTLVIEDMP